MEEKQPNSEPATTDGKPAQSLRKQVLNVFKYATLLRVAISLLVNKFNLKNVAKGLPANLRFGAAVMLMSLIQKTARRWMPKNGILDDWKDLQVFIACALSSVGIWIATPADQGIFKVLVYSRGVISCLKLGQESGWYQCVRSQGEDRHCTIETVLCVLATAAMCYAYLFDVTAMKPSFVRTMTRALGMSKPESMFLDSIRAVEELRKRKLGIKY